MMTRSSTGCKNVLSVMGKCTVVHFLRKPCFLYVLCNTLNLKEEAAKDNNFERGDSAC